MHVDFLQFPWVLCDYDSDNIDLNYPKVYRDLSKPLGIINPNFEPMIRERYNTVTYSLIGVNTKFPLKELSELNLTIDSVVINTTYEIITGLLTGYFMCYCCYVGMKSLRTHQER